MSIDQGASVARLASGRDTYLERDEIAAEALRLFDAGGDVTIRKLAAALKVSPAAIYYHFDNRDQIVQAAVGLVWEEAFTDFFSVAGDLGAAQAQPIEFLVEAALAARRAFGRHYQVAPFVSATPTPDARLAGGLAIFGALFEQLGLKGDRAGAALFAYSTYALGSIVLTASRRVADDAAKAAGTGPDGVFSSVAERPADAPLSDADTVAAIDRAVAVAGNDPEAEEALFLAGLRALLAGLIADAQRDEAATLSV